MQQKEKIETVMTGTDWLNTYRPYLRSITRSAVKKSQRKLEIQRYFGATMLIIAAYIDDPARCGFVAILGLILVLAKRDIL